MDAGRIISHLKGLSNPVNVAGMARFGINTERALGISLSTLRALAKKIKKDHLRSEVLWNTGIHEARILACITDEPDKVTAGQMDRWAADFNSWDICDVCCGSLFDKTPFAREKAVVWSRDEREFVKRAGFALMAWLAVHDKNADDDDFIKFFPNIADASRDERNFVRKAVNWALRQIGKRNMTLNFKAVALAEEIGLLD